MKNLITLVSNENAKQVSEFTTFLNECNTVEEILNKWGLTQYMTKGAKTKSWIFEDLKAYILKRYNDDKNKSLLSKVSHINTIFESGELIEAKIVVEWKKSQMWGSNPNAVLDLTFLDKEGFKRHERFSSGSISGCGFDKCSTAVANVLNQCNPILKSLYVLKDQNPEAVNRELFGYGSGYGVLPNFEGGVGVSCYPSIFDKIGFDFKTIASGKSFDVYTVTKK